VHHLPLDIRRRGRVRVSYLSRLPIRSRVIQGRSTRTGVTMARTKKIVRREWTKEDVRQMKTMAKAKAGVTKIAKSLKRTPGATQVMAAKLGVSLSTRIWSKHRAGLATVAAVHPCREAAATVKCRSPASRCAFPRKS